MMDKRRQLSVRDLSILLWLYAAEVFDPKGPAARSNEKDSENAELKKKRGEQSNEKDRIVDGDRFNGHGCGRQAVAQVVGRHPVAEYLSAEAEEGDAPGVKTP